MVAPSWRSVTLPVATMFCWSPETRSASRNLALSRSGFAGARCSWRSTFSRTSSGNWALATPGPRTQSSARESGRMRLGVKAASGRMLEFVEGYTQNTLLPRSMDDRIRALDAWLRATLPGVPLRLEPASADASFRRYFRVFLEDGTTRIAMDAP